jgi:murein DD-endopeptidase MepM/ murein hydrolase activator NlpD
MHVAKVVVISCGLWLGLAVSAPGASFLQFPLQCGDAKCAFIYNQGAYTYQSINTVLDHSMTQNPNGYWQYGTLPSKSGGDGTIVAFNGERANGAPQGNSASTIVCIKGSVLLKPTPSSPASQAMVNGGGCNGGGAYVYTSYDEHPGYDYRAAYNTPVRAAASGWVIDNGPKHQLCILTNISNACSDWGYVGIDHRNGYITQYGHLSSVKVAYGAWVSVGTIIGYSGHTAPVPLADHLHFEVLALIPGAKSDFTKPLNYAVVDPYGWVGAGADPLYSSSVYRIAPAKLWY